MSEPRDLEGEALEAEIAADAREARERRRRRILFVPPLLALAVAAWALGVSRPRAVLAARAWVSARPPAGEPLRFRAMVVRAVPGLDRVEAAPGVELRPFASGARGRAEPTDDEGVSEVVVDAPLPPSITLEAKLPGGGFQQVATIDLGALPDPDPAGFALDVRRTYGKSVGELRIDVAPEKGALAPPVAGAAWIRVRDEAGRAVAGARITMTAEAGLADDPAPTTTDPAGLARVALAPIASPVVVTVKAEQAGRKATWTGTLGAVLGAPVLEGDGRLSRGARAIPLLATTSRPIAWVDVFDHGVRIAGGRVRFEGGRALFPLPERTSNVLEIETGTSPLPPNREDLAHAASFPIVLANDATDALAEVTASLRFPEKIPSATGVLATHASAAVASIAFAPPALAPRVLAGDGLAEALRREEARGRMVRRAASAAILGGGLVELGLMFALGILGAKRSIADELADLTDEPIAPKPEVGRRVAAIAVIAVGIVVLVFAAMATMAWGLPG